MEYIQCEIDLNNKKLIREVFTDLNSAILSISNMWSYTCHEDYMGSISEYNETIKYGQGWIAYYDDSYIGNVYCILYKNEAGILEHFLNHCKQPITVRQILYRQINLEKLIG